MKRILLQKVVFLSVILPLFLLAQILIPNTSFADPVETVTNTADAGPGSLRDAIANVDPGGTVNFDIPGPVPHTIGLLSQIIIDKPMTIAGPGADEVTIDAQMNDRIFEINDGNASLSAVSIGGLRFINGGVVGIGGAILNEEDLSIDSCVFENNNSSSNGGTIFSNVDSMLEITNSLFSGNSANFNGGAIFTNSRTTVKRIFNSTFSGNKARFNGGAIFFNNNNVVQEIANSTFNGNMVENDGGAIYSNSRTVIEQIVNSTFSGNMAGDGEFDNAGAIFINTDGIVNISFTTITNNVAGDRGGAILQNEGGVANIRNSIVAFNTAAQGNNCDTALSDMGNNYSNDSTCGFGPGDNAAIELGLLAGNGGPTETVALISGAPVDGASAACDPLGIDGSPTGISLNIDQRFFPRPGGLACDSGAFEIEGPRPIPTLSEWGLIAMALILGVIGILVVRRRAKVIS